jgi:hypothetical protein
MKFLNWLKGKLSHRNKAMWLYRRGMLKAKLRDHRAAIADYTTVIDMADATDSLRAMALYNRSLVHAAVNQMPQAMDDLRSLLELPGATGNVKTEARRKLLRMGRTSDRADEHMKRSKA